MASRLNLFLMGVVVLLTSTTARAERFETLPGLFVDVDEGAMVRVLLDDEPVATIAPTVTPTTSLARQWPYFHLHGIVFLESSLEGPPSPTAVTIGTDAFVRMRENSIHVHRGVGKALQANVRVPVFALERGDGSSILLAIVRSDGGQLHRVGRVFEWEGSPQRWSLAIVTAESEDILWHHIGKALIAGQDNTGRPLKDWQAPPICARCATPAITRLSLEWREESAELSVRTSMADEHSQPSFATLHVDGVPFGANLLEQYGNSAVYQLPKEFPERRENPTVQLLSISGQPIEIDQVVVNSKLSAAFPDRLSLSLLSAWPNPFYGGEGTSVQYTVPRTVGEAFDFEEGVPSGVDLAAAPPFGANPAVNLRVYNVQGQLVRVLTDEVGTVGEYSLFWSGDDMADRPVAAGTYFLRLELGEQSVTKRVTLLKP